MIIEKQSQPTYPQRKQYKTNMTKKDSHLTKFIRIHQLFLTKKIDLKNEHNLNKIL